MGCVTRLAYAQPCHYTIRRSSKALTRALVMVQSCGADGTRTRDPHTASVVRYQLRYSPEAITGGLPVPRRCAWKTVHDGPAVNEIGVLDPSCGVPRLVGRQP